MGSLDKRFPKYSRLLKLYPADYQKKYKEQMLQTLADMLDDAENDKALVWLRVSADLPLNLFKQNLIYAGGIMRNETPHYVKRNSLLGASLLLPFFALVFINSFSRHALDIHSAEEQKLFIFLVTILPLIAFLLGVFTYIRWVSERRLGFWRSLADIRRNWLMLATTGLALLIVLFVPFHDSVHCISGNPIRELRNPSETWACIEADRS